MNVVVGSDCVFCAVHDCSVEGVRCFGEMYCFLLQGWKANSKQIEVIGVRMRLDDTGWLQGRRGKKKPGMEDEACVKLGLIL